MKNKTITTLGVDIGTYSVKWVELLRTADAVKLQQFNVLTLENDSPEKLNEALKQILASFSIPPKHVRVAVSGSSVVVRCVNLPIMTREELQGAIKFEAESHIPFPIDECILDFQILKQFPDKKLMNVLLVAAQKSFVQQRLSMLNEFGFKPELIDADALCLLNAFEVLNDLPDQKTYALLNMGHHVSLFVITQGGLPFFVRDLSFGGDNVTKALLEVRPTLSAGEAELLKMNRSFENLNDLKLASQKALLTLGDELKQYVDYFENETGEELQNVWISGGASMSVGTPVVLSERLGKKVDIWDNTRKLEISGRLDLKLLKEHAAELNVAFGLALRDAKG